MKKIKIEQRIKETIQYYESIITKMPGHVYWLDRHGLALGCNQNVLNMFGFKSVNEFKGLSFEKMGEICNWSLETIQSFKKDSLEVLRTGQPKLNIEEPPIPNRDGQLIYFLTNRVPIIDNNRNVVSMIGISVDITERKRLEENLKLTKEKAEAANNTKTEFIRNISHDLRTPLSGIIGLSQLQAKEGASIQEKEYGQWIYGAAQQLLELLNSVVESAVIEDPLELIKKDRFDLIQIAEELRTLMQASILSKKLTFQLKLDAVPFIITDRIKLKRILLNLLSNAVKFTKKGTISLEINLLSIKDNKVKISMMVSDTGIGISKDKQEKIFDRFYRVHPSYLAEYSGYGLGLYLVKKSTEALGGTINVSSIEGEGSCFSLEFNFALAEPANNLSANNLEPSSDGDLQSLATIKLKGSVLIAEDNILVAYVVKKLLTGFGCQVEIASTGEAALQILQTQTFNCGLLDIGLPGLDGIEVTRRYREWELLNNKTYLPIFALTAHAEEKVKQECQAAGCDQVLLKPFTEKDVKTIKKFFQ